MTEDQKKIIASIPYRLKIMASIIASELLMLTMILFWPVEKKSQNYQDIVYSETEIAMEKVEITTQESSPPPPPAPIVPVPVPDDEIIEEEIVFEELDLQEFNKPMELEGMGVLGERDQVAANPQRPPSVVRIVEPTVPSEAKKADVKAEIWVSFLVNREGDVEEASISQIKLFDKNKEEFVLVNQINYGLAEATIEAALKWKFRPAKNQGEIVKAYTKHIFTYGY
ncbi:MAG: hypothetical protein R3224_09925 [Balneolaceae bacterium]|nr:hypothetical protein [Balneolaceae bacterium]